MGSTGFIGGRRGGMTSLMERELGAALRRSRDRAFPGLNLCCLRLNCTARAA